MDRERYKLGLSFLNQTEYREGEILYWACRGEKKESIKNYINSNETTVWFRMQTIVDKLNNAGVQAEIDRGIINTEICTYLLDVVGDPAQFDPWPPEEAQLPLVQAKAEDSARTKWLLLGGIIGAVIGLLLGGLAGASLFRPESPIPEMLTVVETAEVTRIEEIIKEVTKIAEVTRLVTEEVPVTVIVEGAVRELEVTREETSEAQQPVSTLLPEDTVETAQPDSTPIPLIEIADNFDGDELSGWWTKIGGGDLTLGGGLLATDNDLLLEMGEQSWRNYVVEVDVARTISGVRLGNYVEFLKTDEDGLLITFDRGLGSQIFMLQNGEWERDGRTFFQQNSEGKTIRVEVKDGRIDVWINGTQVIENYVTPLTEGKIGLKITEGTFVDAFRVSPLE